jgi:hypothetical protein
VEQVCGSSVVGELQATSRYGLHARDKHVMDCDNE